MAADTLNFSELKNLKLPAIKQKMLDLGLDTKDSKADLLVKLEKLLKFEKQIQAVCHHVFQGLLLALPRQSRL